jgi:pyrimidine-nucleoside phosphorylase
MNEPLGRYVGNALEVKEAIDVLSGKGEERLTDLCITLASNMYMMGSDTDSYDLAKEEVLRVIREGKALDKLAELVKTQGGDENQVYHPETLPKALYCMDVLAEQDGYLASCKTSEVGMTSLILGGGRETKESEIDLSVGIRIDKRLGEHVDKGERIAVLYANESEKLEDAKKRFVNAYTFSDTEVKAEPLIKKIISRKDIMA